MDSLLAYCGLVCDSCPIHPATLEQDISRQIEMRILIAEQLAGIYGTAPRPEIITDCDGCKVKNGRLFTGCTDCEIRKCAVTKNLMNCACCTDYPCEKLEKHFTFDPASREKLNEIRRKYYFKENV